jgi:hypothetical protein
MEDRQENAGKQKPRGPGSAQLRNFPGGKYAGKQNGSLSGSNLFKS